ncbi:SIMPL domain-containing protein [Rubrivirga litoralis]|uniref:SIMPL domain-containing protein n=1 Tax=Rubrivirga litoralis TaxID=3075598 RepID=A0ABU3BVI8_9BACT|nr:SIMPL domain-containing protein [Rubrivirga sp. F394]MDT0633302.1 SIMPL domain-containing protein [Rubrivirga sp. F394]
MLRLLLPALLLAAAAASAQPALDDGAITVSGEGLVSAPPDRAVVRLGVVTEAPTAAEALRQHEDDVARVLARVRSFGIADRQIQIDALQLGQNYGPNGPDGYQATRVVSVTTDSLAAIPDLVASVVESGANRLDGIGYTLSEPGRYRDRALDEAVAQARAKAERLATAAGASLGEVVSIQEQGVGMVPPYRGGAMMDVAVAAVRVEAEPGAYSTGSSQVRAGVVVRYRLVAR